MTGDNVQARSAGGGGRKRGSPAWAAGGARWLAEAAGLALALAGLSFFLARSYILKAYSDPVQWYSFGQHFAERFGENHLAYLFPLLVAGVTEIVGPFRAFLINIPLLVVLALLLYVFGRQLLGGPRSPALGRWAPQAGAATLLLFVLVAGTSEWEESMTMLRLLASPYRDVLAHVLLLASLIALVSHRRSPAHALAPVVVSAACLALATSTREASVLGLIPMALYALGCRLSSRALPFLRPVLVFAFTFAIFLVPYLIQNYLYSGNPLIPAQAANPSTGGLKYSTMVPGVAYANLSRTFPLTLVYLYLHYGPGVVGLMGVGMAVALRYRLEAVVYLTLPGLLLYLGFYGAYYTAVARYLFVVDLFALPLAGVGVAGCLCLLVSRASPRVRERIATASLLALFVLAAATGVRHAVPAGGPFRITDAMALHADAAELLPERAAILGDRPLAEIFRSFVDDRARMLEFLVPSRLLGDPEFFDRLDEIVQRGEPVYVVTPRETTRQVLREGFNLPLVRSFSAADYGLENLLKARRFSLHRLMPWTRTETTAELRSHRTGPHVLSLNVGRFSRKGGHATLYWDDRRLDPPPRDGWNCYDVMVASESAPTSLRLVSDRPVPDELFARLHDPVRTRFPGGYYRYDRFLPRCLDRESALPAAGLQRVAIPVFVPEEAAFVVRASLEIDARTPGSRGLLEARAGDRSLYRGGYLRGLGGGKSTFVSFLFVLLEVQGSAGRALVDIEATGPGGEHDDVRMRSLEVYRHRLSEELEVWPGRVGHEIFLRSGFYGRPAGSGGPLAYLWTRGRASLWLLVSPSDRPRELEVRYLIGWRPPGVPPPAPRFRLNGRLLEEFAEFRKERRIPQSRALSPALGATVPDVYTEVTRIFELPPALLPDPENVLRIEATEWVPSETIPAEPRDRRLGLMLSRVSVKPGPSRGRPARPRHPTTR